MLFSSFSQLLFSFSFFSVCIFFVSILITLQKFFNFWCVNLNTKWSCLWIINGSSNRWHAQSNQSIDEISLNDIQQGSWMQPKFEEKKTPRQILWWWMNDKVNGWRIHHPTEYNLINLYSFERTKKKVAVKLKGAKYLFFFWLHDIDYYLHHTLPIWRKWRLISLSSMMPFHNSVNLCGQFNQKIIQWSL